MAVQFALKMVFRVHSVPLLKEYVKARDQADRITIDADDLDVDRLYEQWESLPPEARNQMEAELRAVHDMATSDIELTTVLQEAEFHGHADELRQAFAGLNSLHDKMLWTLLHYPRIFEVANLFEQTEDLNLRSWKKRSGLPQRPPHDDAEACNNLAAALSQYYINREGRGRGGHHVEPYKRGDEVYYYVYLRDHPRMGVIFDDRGGFKRKPLEDSFEIIYRFNPTKGTLETFVQGKPQVVEDVQEIFARVCLDADLPPPARPTAVYDFNKLMRRNFNFTTEPEDGVLSTRVKSLRLWIRGTKRKITLTEGDGNNTDGVYDLLDAATSNEANGLHRALLNVTRAELQMVFRRDQGRNKTLTFAISWPDWCNLKDNREHLIAKKYLNRWLALDEPAAADTPQPALAG